MFSNDKIATLNFWKAQHCPSKSYWLRKVPIRYIRMELWLQNCSLDRKWLCPSHVSPSPRLQNKNWAVWQVPGHQRAFWCSAWSSVFWSCFNLCCKGHWLSNSSDKCEVNIKASTDVCLGICRSPSSALQMPCGCFFQRGTGRASAVRLIFLQKLPKPQKL